MSLSKFKLLQPTIIKFSYTYDLPKALRNQYVINFNAMGIDWFTENFITLETGKGFLIQENPEWDKHTKAEPIKFLLEDFDSDKFDIPRVYIVIKEEYIDDDGKIFDFIQQSLSNNTIYGTGIKGMMPGIDYYVNETLYKYLTRTQDSLGNTIHPYIPVSSDIVVPNFLSTDGDINYDIYEELSDTESDYINLKYYYQKNKSLSYSFTENQINNICATFAQTILDLSNISEEALLEPKNQAYKACLEYFANGGTDCATRMLDLILGQSFATPNTATNQGILGNCGACNANTTSSDGTSQSCLDLYKEGMKELFKSMLSNPDFYDDWMNDELGDGMMPNSCLIQNLKDLLDAYEESHKNTGRGNGLNKGKNCSCPKISSNKSKNDDFEDFDNYEDLLDYVCDGTMDENKNKTRLFGEAFADDLLSKCSGF